MKHYEVPGVELGYGTSRHRCWMDGDGWSSTAVSRWIRSTDGKEIWLTARQLQCLAMSLVHGRKMAAAKIGISIHSLKGHMYRLGEQLGTQSAADAALELGWLKVPPELLE